MAAKTLAGDAISSKLIAAPGNGSPIGGIKLSTLHGWVIDLVTPQKPPSEQNFESSQSVDARARAAIMRQVCEHGLGLFWIVPDQHFHREGFERKRAA